MTIEQLQKNLEQAEGRVQELFEIGRWDVAKLGAAFEARSQAERELAAALGQEHAVELHLGIYPEAAVSGPVLLQDDYDAFLAFNGMRLRPDGLREAAGLAVVEFVGCSTTKFGYPNDEARPGHPLSKRGLGGYGIYEVMNSSWIEEQAQMNRVHFPNFSMRPVRHFMFTFHESTLDCITTDIKLEIAPYSPRFKHIYDQMMMPHRPCRLPKQRYRRPQRRR